MDVPSFVGNLIDEEGGMNTIGHGDNEDAHRMRSESNLIQINQHAMKRLRVGNAILPKQISESNS